MESFWKDIRFGVRLLIKNRAFTLVSVVTLGLGVGATTGIFSVVNSVLLRPLTYGQPDRIVKVSSYRVGKLGQISPANFLDWREQARSFQDMAAIFIGGGNLVSTSGPERIQLAITSASFFDVIGVQPIRGRGFLPDDEAEGHRPVAVVSHRLWQQQFNSRDGP
ncbi:MAG TPA: ABC transporter permease, partial [Blastocatellia bacterium]